MNVLRGAGVPVLPTSALAPPGFGGKGQVVQIGEELVQVYNYATVEDRRDDSRSIAIGQWPSGDPIEAGLSVWTAGRLIVTYGGTDGGTHLLLEAVLGDPITRAAEVVDEPYPAAVPFVLAEAAGLLGLAATSIEVIGLEEATWPDSCLGLPRAEETCSPGAVPGWNILVRGGDVRARYRTDVRGEVVRLEETMDEP